MGFYIGIGGYITYPKNNELRDLVKNIPLDRLLLETDAPFLPPQQYRGKKKFTSVHSIICHTIANIKEISNQELAKTTTTNVYKVFRNIPR